MAHSQRGGEVDLKQIDVLLSSSVPANTISVGDFVFATVSGSKAFATQMTDFVWDTNLATTQAAAVLLLLGVASGRSRDAVSLVDHPEDTQVLVNMDGEFDFDCASATYNIGQYIGAKKAAGNALLQTLEAVATKSLAFAVVTQNTVGAQTRVRARLINTPPKR